MPDQPSPRIDLTLPADPAYLDLARANVLAMARLAGLSDERAATLVDVVVDVGRRTIERAADPARPGAIALSLSLTPATLEIAIDDRGLPFDPDRTLSEAPTGPGSLSERLHRVVDGVQWANRGRAGVELRLTVDRPATDITGHLPADQLTRFPAQVPLAPDQNYTLRRLQPADAIGVAQGIYRAYGYDYPNDDLYYPDRIVHLNETGQLVSIVTLDEAGEVVGHYALERPDLGPIAETGQVVVSPAHGHRRLMERMRTVLEEEAGKLGLAGLYGQPVTSHTFSQRGVDQFGARVCGVSLAHSPPVNFSQIRAEPLSQRESLLHCFKYLSAKPAATVHLPERHRAIAERVYAQFNAVLDLRPGRPVPGETGEVSVSYEPGWGYATIRVRRIGSDTAAGIRQARRDLTAASSVPVVYLEIPLAQAAAPDLIEAAEADGFFFSGISPHSAPDGDALCLQYLNVPLETSVLQIYSPFGQELLAYVEQERQRLTPTGGTPPCVSGSA